MIELMKEIEEHTERLKALLAEQGLTVELTEEEIEEIQLEHLRGDADDADRAEAEAEAEDYEQFAENNDY